MSYELQGVEWRSILPTKLVAAATSLEGSKNNYGSFICGQSSTNPANFVKIDLIDAEIIGVTKVTKNILKIKNISKTYAHLACASRRAGGLKACSQRTN